jgi:release factor glutamine methyltransferase
VTDGLTIRRAQEGSGLVPLDAQVLLAHALGRDRTWLAAHAGERLPRAAADTFFALAKRRRDGEPIAYLTGFREFWGLPLAVSRAVLIPRPETETLVEVALGRLPADRDVAVLDLGTGSGAIALAIARERPRARVVATDLSAEALAVARANATRLGIANVDCVCADWYAGIPATRFDVIAANPPYVEPQDPHLGEGDLRFEPRAALTPGGDGLRALRDIVVDARAHLVPGGTLAVEHGYDQSDAVLALFAAAGFADVVTARDLSGTNRVVAGRSPR